jgi:hypothetical protein
MKVLILGSNRHLQDEQKAGFAEACEALGAAFAQGGRSLLLCSQSSHTVDPYVLKGTKRKKAKNSVVLYQPSVTENVEQGLPPAESPDAKLWKDVPTKIVEGGWRVVHLRAIRDADAVVAIGGSAGSTQTAIYSAELLLKPTILIPTFRGTAFDNWGYFRGRYYREEEAERLRQSWDGRADDTAKSVVETIGTIVKRQAQPISAPLERAGLVLLALSSLVLWTYVMFAMPKFIPPALALCLLLAAASVSGSILRVFLRNLGALSTDWAESHAAMSIVLGLLIGFGLLLIGGFANLSLNAKMMTVDTYDDARRIGLTFSPLLFLVALFLEQAWARLSQRGLGRLKSS